MQPSRFLYYFFTTSILRLTTRKYCQQRIAQGKSEILKFWILVWSFCMTIGVLPRFVASHIFHEPQVHKLWCGFVGHPLHTRIARVLLFWRTPHVHHARVSISASTLGLVAEAAPHFTNHLSLTSCIQLVNIVVKYHHRTIWNSFFDI